MLWRTADLTARRRSSQGIPLARRSRRAPLVSAEATLKEIVSALARFPQSDELSKPSGACCAFHLTRTDGRNGQDGLTEPAVQWEGMAQLSVSLAAWARSANVNPADTRGFMDRCRARFHVVAK